MIPTNRKISLTTYTTPIFLVVSFIVLVVLVEYRRAVAGSFDGLKGGSQAGLALAYTGSLLLLAAQFYTIVRRSAWIGFIKSVGGVRPWLSIHITLSFIGLIAVLVHAGFPYRFNQRDPLNHGLAGLTTWLLVASAASGIFGRYIYKRLPAMKRIFEYWKPSHLLITGLLFYAAIIHMITTFGN
jgi:hypothetical protein